LKVLSCVQRASIRVFGSENRRTFIASFLHPQTLNRRIAPCGIAA